MAATGGSASIAHLPDASEGVAATADLTIRVESTQLKLHSVVLGAGSRVLRSAFASCDGDPTAHAAAVAKTFEGHKLADVQLFLKLLYDPTAAEDITSVDMESWRGVLQLTDQLDAPAVLRACDAWLARHLTLTSATCGINWQEWLLLADRLSMTRLVGHCVAPMMKTMNTSATVKQALPALAPLSKRTYQLMLEANMCASVAYAGSSVAQRVPATSSWSAPGDLFP